MVFLHPTAVAALRAYDAGPRRGVPRAGAGTFLVNSRGRPLDAATPPRLRRAGHGGGIKAPPGQRAPRLHDLRHVFTVATLLDWYRDGGDVQARLPVLSTWLGHVDPKSTYWYLSAVPELLALAAARLEPAGGRRGHDRPRPVLQGFFTDRLVRQKKASPNTVAAYRDTCPAAARLRPQPAPARRPAQLEPRRPRRRPGRRVPAAPGRPSGATARHPQRPPGRDPLALQATRPRAHPSTPR